MHACVCVCVCLCVCTTDNIPHMDWIVNNPVNYVE